MFVIISFNIQQDVKQDEIINTERTDFSIENENFTKIKIYINNIYENPHKFTIKFYAENSYINSDTYYLLPEQECGTSRVFRIDDQMNASFVVILDNQTEPFDEIKFDFHECNQN
ncbi:MAG: hypothetical protein KAT48_14015 [Bacteroidales bacterium]|nr:hypothetical protein [Bacteroidales bacterium]